MMAIFTCYTVHIYMDEDEHEGKICMHTLSFLYHSSFFVHAVFGN